MANHLKMAKVHAIQALREQGWSLRRISRELGISRDTVTRYVKLGLGAAEPIAGPLIQSRPNPTAGVDGQTIPNPPPGSGEQPELIAGVEESIPNPPPGSFDQTRPNPPTGVDGQTIPNPPAGSSGPDSCCEPYREMIVDSLERGLSRQRIWQDLKDVHQFSGAYDCVKRFVRKLGRSRPLPFRRMECEPGEEAQVDFGTGSPVIIPVGDPLPVGVQSRRRKTHVFRIVLSHSRKAYSEAVYRQSTADFIRCLENAFWYFGGIPRTLVIDNLKAAVIQADWYDPELNPKLQSFCKHYGTVILPTRPRTPRHKGKVERGIGYVQSNALKARTFSSLAEQNLHLLNWEKQVADQRIHGTTQKQVKKSFEEVERAALLPLPSKRFPCFEEGKRRVNRDGHVEVAKAYYSVPPEYLGRSVWVRWDSHVVRIFNQRFEQIAIHARGEPGDFSSQEPHTDERKRSGIERGAAYHLNKASLIGPHTGQWAAEVIQQRSIEGIRVVQGLLSLSKRHPAQVIERACETARTHGAYRLRTIRELIKRQGDRQEQFEFIDEHPIIRSLSDYRDLVHTAFS